MSDNDTAQAEDVERPEVMPVYRQSQPVIFRDEGGEPTVEARIVPYGEWSEVDSLIEGHFLERFDMGSFRKTLAERAAEIKVYFEHGRDKVFGTQVVGILRDAWEQDDGLYFRAGLLQGLPELFMDGLRRSLYGASVGAKVVQMKRDRAPEASDHNPNRLEERTYKEMRAFDFSLTPRPHYASATVALRSITDDLMVAKLLEDPAKLLAAITRRTELEHDTTNPPTEPEAEPPHSEPTQPEAPAVEGSRSTQPSRDYLQPKEDEPSWRL